MKPAKRFLAMATVGVLSAYTSFAGTCIIKEPSTKQPVGTAGICASRLETGSAVPAALASALEARFRTFGSAILDVLLDCTKPGFHIFFK